MYSYIGGGGSRGSHAGYRAGIKLAIWTIMGELDSTLVDTVDTNEALCEVQIT